MYTRTGEVQYTIEFVAVGGELICTFKSRIGHVMLVFDTKLALVGYNDTAHTVREVHKLAQARVKYGPGRLTIRWNDVRNTWMICNAVNIPSTEVIKWTSNAYTTADNISAMLCRVPARGVDTLALPKFRQHKIATKVRMLRGYLVDDVLETLLRLMFVLVMNDHTNYCEEALGYPHF